MYRKGGVLLTLEEFDAWASAGGWVLWHERPKHPSILSNQQYAGLKRIIQGGHIFKAIRNEGK